MTQALSSNVLPDERLGRFPRWMVFIGMPSSENETADADLKMHPDQDKVKAALCFADNTQSRDHIRSSVPRFNSRPLMSLGGVFKTTAELNI